MTHQREKPHLLQQSIIGFTLFTLFDQKKYRGDPSIENPENGVHWNCIKRTKMAATPLQHKINPTQKT